MTFEYNVYLCYGNGSSRSFKLDTGQIEQRLKKTFWIDLLKNEMIKLSNELIGILDGSTYTPFYTQDVSSKSGDIKTLSEILSAIYTGFEAKMFQSEVKEGEYVGGKLYNLYPSQFDYRNSKAFSIARLFHYNSEIVNDEEIKELTDGNSEIYQTLTFGQINRLNGYVWENTRVKIEKVKENSNFDEIHNQIQLLETNGMATYKNSDDEEIRIHKVQARFPKDELNGKKYGILLEQVATGDYVYYEQNVSRSDLCFISRGGVEIAGTGYYGEAIEMGSSSKVLNSAELPKYEIMDKKNKKYLTSAF